MFFAKTFKKNSLEKLGYCQRWPPELSSWFLARGFHATVVDNNLKCLDLKILVQRIQSMLKNAANI